MLTREDMKGLYVLVITPFDTSFRLDEEGYRENVRKLVGLGIDGVITTGTNGEFFVVTDQELRRLARITREECGDRVRTVIGASAVNTEDSIRRSRIALEEGADAVMNVIPFYQTLSKAEAYRYFEELGAACPGLGLIAYNNPGTTKVLLDDGDFVKMDPIPTMCGSKMVGSDVALYMNCLRRTKMRHFPLEQLWGISHIVGGNGVMASFIYTFPSFMMKWWNAIRGGDVTTAIAMQHECNRILEQAIVPLAYEGFNDTALTKATIDAAGVFKAGPPRRPTIAVPPERIRQLRDTLTRDFGHFMSHAEAR